VVFTLLSLPLPLPLPIHCSPLFYSLPCPFGNATKLNLVDGLLQQQHSRVACYKNNRSTGSRRVREKKRAREKRREEEESHPQLTAFPNL